MVLQRLIHESLDTGNSASRETTLGRLRVLLADDHAAFLDKVATFLAPEFDVVGMTANGREMLIEAKRLRPDVVILDITMPILDGISAATELCASDSSAKVVFLTVQDDTGFVHAGLAAGALGYVTKNRVTIDLRIAIREILQGHRFLSPGLQTRKDHAKEDDPR